MHEIDKARFGAIIAAARKERGMTQKDLAQKLFISDKAVSKWETGVSLPDTSLLIPLSETLGIPVAELLTGQKDPEPDGSGPFALEAGIPLRAQVRRLCLHRAAYAGSRHPPIGAGTR